MITNQCDTCGKGVPGYGPRRGKDWPGNALRQDVWNAVLKAEAAGLTPFQIMKDVAQVLSDIPHPELKPKEDGE